MEYCITVFRKELNPSSAFYASDAVRTAWGDAEKAEEYGKLFWKRGMYIQPTPLVNYLLERLPQQCSMQEWICLSVGDSETKMFNFNITYDAADDEGSAGSAQQLDLISLLDALLHDQSSWAVFFEKHCDQLMEVSASSLPKLLSDVSSVYQYTSLLAQGFGAYCCPE